VWSFGDNVLRKGKPRGNPIAASTDAAGRPGLSGMVNICELSLNVVKWNKPKVLTGLAKRQGGGSVAVPSSLADKVLPGGETGPNPFGYTGGKQ